MTPQHRRWLETSELVPMFPTMVWKLQIDASLRETMDARMLDALRGLRHGLPPLAAGQGWQSGQALHERGDFAEFVSCVRNGVTSVLRFLRIGDEPWEVTGCWATVLAPGAAHKLHSHPNNFLSGVYYLCAPPGADTIYFHDPRRQAAVIRPPVVELTAENTDQVVVHVRTGTLLLFPSFVEHSVDANASDEERVSVSFNVMFSFAERIAKPLWDSGR